MTNRARSAARASSRDFPFTGSGQGIGSGWERHWIFDLGKLSPPSPWPSPPGEGSPFDGGPESEAEAEADEEEDWGNEADGEEGSLVDGWTFDGAVLFCSFCIC